MEIDFNWLRFFEECFVDDIFISVNLVLPISIIGLIQSHGQAGPASPALVQENPDGLHLFVAEICGDLLSGRRCNFEHGVLLAKLFYRMSLEASGLASYHSPDQSNLNVGNPAL
jgi:hypothetical protein